MNIQYISDRKGKRTGVILPIKEWNKIKAQLQLAADEQVVLLTTYDKKDKANLESGEVDQLLNDL